MRRRRQHREHQGSAPLGVRSEQLGTLARRGTVWLALEQGTNWLLSFGSRILLARLLTPHDFGLVAMVLLVQGLVQLLGMRGVSAAVVQRQKDVDEIATAAFWLNPIIGSLIGLTQILVAPAVASFYHEPLLRWLLTASAIGFFVSPWGATHATLLQKTLQLQRRTARQIILRVVITGGIVVMAYAGFGVWSFVIPPLLGDPIEVFLNWRFCPWRPRLRLYVHRWKDIFGFGKDVLGADVLRYFTDNTDYMFVGRLLGASPLGFYSFAFRQSMVAMQNVTVTAAKVAFPTFAALQSDREQLTRTFTKAILLISCVTLPMQIGQFVIAPEYMEVIYGPKWLPAVFAFRVLLIYGSAIAISGLARPILAATGRPDIAWKWSLVVLPLLASAISVGVRWGINGVAVAVGVVLGGSSWLFLTFTIRRLGLHWSAVYRTLWPPLASALVMAGIVHITRTALYAVQASKPLILIVCIAIGMITYVLALATLFRSTWREFVGFVLRALGDFGRWFGEARRRRAVLSAALPE